MIAMFMHVYTHETHVIRRYWYDMGMNETMLDAKFPFGPGVNITDKPLTTFRV